MKQWFLVAYDVRDPKRLRRVAKKLEGYGVRMQFSVFRCHLSAREIERLQWELAKIMEQEDELLVLGLCLKCAMRVANRAGKVGWPKDPPLYEVI